MPSQPQYGGTSGVEELDLGQPGSARAAANKAKYTVHVKTVAGPPRIVTHELAQNSAAYQDSLGPSRLGFEWRGLLKVDAVQTAIDIEHQILKLLDGYGRSLSGTFDSFSETNLRPTTITDGFGNTRSTMARIVSYRMGDRIRKITGSATFNYMTELSVAFTTLG